MEPLYLRDGKRGLARKFPAEGPAGKLTGALVAAVAFGCDLSYEPEEQTWTRLPGAADEPGVWLGIDRRDRLRPDDVIRDEVRSGHRVQLGDGQLWEIPVARLALGGCGLPRTRVLRPDGSKGWKVDAQYAEVCAFAEKAWQYHTGGAGVVIEDEEIDRACGMALGINYRIGEMEAVALGLFTDVALQSIVRALIDYPTIERVLEAQKKS
jgi:hypothetical protein